MKHFTTPDFWHAYKGLPVSVQKLADQNFELLKTNPRHPSLNFKRAGHFWSARVGRSWRALAVEDGEAMIWFWIGSHADYDKLVR